MIEVNESITSLVLDTNKVEVVHGLIFNSAITLSSCTAPPLTSRGQDLLPPTKPTLGIALSFSSYKNNSAS